MAQPSKDACSSTYDLGANVRQYVGRVLEIGDTSSDLALAERVEAGLPVSAIDSLARHGVPDSFIFKIVPRRTWQRRRKRDEPLTTEESDRAERVARLLALAAIVFDDEERGARWLASPKQQFANRAPLELLRTKVGIDVVERTLLQAYYGLVA